MVDRAGVHRPAKHSDRALVFVESPSDEFADQHLFAELDGWTLGMRQIVGMYDAPAFIRRALRVEQAFRELTQRCQLQRNEWLDAVRRRLRAWTTLSSRDPGVDKSLSEEQRIGLRQLQAAIADPHQPLGAWARPGRFRQVWSDLWESVDRFNLRWDRYVDRIDLAPINRLVDGYNRHYVLEKECAVRSIRLASRGFSPLPPVDRQWIRDRFPILPSLAASGATGGRTSPNPNAGP